MRSVHWLLIPACVAACDPQLTLHQSESVPSVTPFDAATIPDKPEDAGALDSSFRDSVFGYLDATTPSSDAGPCHAGEACSAENGCRRGQITCGAGGAACEALGEPFTMRTTPCADVRACDGNGACTFCGGTNQPCCGSKCEDGLSCYADGTCRACKQGGACDVQDEPCQVGALSCGDSASCDNPKARDRAVSCGERKACDGNGTCGPCGADGQVCCAGDCGKALFCNTDTKTCFACDLAAACVPDNPCRLGMVSCADGKSTCEAYLDADRGATCGENKACDGLANCEACGAQGQPCCETTCDDGLVCSATGRTCTACDADAACLSENGCRSGKIVCDKEGAAQCKQDADVARAKTCADGQACDGSGNCVSCGGVGEPCCDDKCSTGNVCNKDTHNCEVCPQGKACLSDDGCDTGTIECSSGAPVCNLTGVAKRGTGCGDGKACDGSGACGVCGDLDEPCCDGKCGKEQRCSPELSCEGCPVGTVYVAGGTFQMGAPSGDGPRCDVADVDEQPVHEVTVEAMCADLKEVSVLQYSACSDCIFPTIASDGMTADEFDDCNQPSSPTLPMNCVTWDEAAHFCASRDMRLPTEAEWEYLARGTTGRSYPWGNGACDDCSLANVSGCESGTLPVGTLTAGASTFGLLDMAGNVAEWVADRYAADFYSSASALGISPRGPSRGDQRVLRGGDYTRGIAAAASTDRDSADPGTRRAALGLRCVRSMP